MVLSGWSWLILFNIKIYYNFILYINYVFKDISISCFLYFCWFPSYFCWLYLWGISLFVSVSPLIYDLLSLTAYLLFYAFMRWYTFTFYLSLAFPFLIFNIGTLKFLKSYLLLLLNFSNTFSLLTAFFYLTHSSIYSL